MNTQAIEFALVALKLPISTHIKAAIAHREKVREMTDPDLLDEIQKQVQQRVGAGESFDVASRDVARKLFADAVRLVDVAVTGSARQLLELKREATLELFTEVRTLGDIPNDPESAMNAGPAAIMRFKRWKALAARYGQLYRLHELLLAGDDSRRLAAVNPTSWTLFSDTQAWPLPSGTRPRTVAFGPHDEPFAESLPIRLRFLVTHEQFWQPDADECTNHWLNYCQEMSADPRTAAARGRS